MLERGSGIGVRDTTITDVARVSFYRATGITPDYQIALEQYYDAFEIGDFDNSVTVMDGMVELCPPAFIRHL